ncbi:MAG: hypothetical protein MUE44_15430 [Oscillatoriaceae cyanobacterium Prado104]|jgi:hypothetical protein|nr:hypothetical protein [Oscillatoriaceae cyanobacterium Prado104]
MIRSTDRFVVGFIAISAAIALPCRAQTVVNLPQELTETNQITVQTESQDINNTSVAGRTKTINNSKSFTISETTSIPANSSSIAAPAESQPLRSNPLGCRFFYTPSMQQ